MRELLAKHGAAPVDAGADSAQFHAKSFCDLVIRKALKITKNDGGSEVGQLTQRQQKLAAEKDALEAEWLAQLEIAEA